MPQVPSPNMGIIWPTDNDDANVWAPIMDTAVRVVIDGHNHAAGNGAKISISQLAFDADISFVDSGGGKHAITDLKAIDFFPIDPTAVTALAGALFLNNADNELYYRTAGGVNVKITNGAALNFAAFVGGIGGDYQAVGALESYDDASTAYVFQQQLAVAVRQYAKLRAADLQLYEYKIHGTAGVPNFSVTLKSPAALANNYALTLPGALPSQAEGLSVDAAGNVTAGSKFGPRTIQFPVSFSSPGFWQFSATPLTLVQTVPVLTNGERILAVRLRMRDNATGPTKLTVSLQSVVDGTPTTIATSPQSAGTGALQTIQATGLAFTVASGTNYQILIATATGAAASTAYWIEIDCDRP